jgi:GPH family glycoside/pentoside/hexuronide:cation symporter
MFATYFISSPSLLGCWLMIESMTADVCDDDELRSGRRREGMFSAMKGFALKAA